MKDLDVNDPICAECTYKQGWTPKKHVVGHWFDYCSDCRGYRGCTAVRDWVRPKAVENK